MTLAATKRAATRPARDCRYSAIVDDWRVTVVLADTSARWPDDLHLLEHEASLPQGVEISPAGKQIFAYPDTDRDALAAQQTLERFFARRAVPVQTVVERWNPGSDEWVDPWLPVEAPDEPPREFDIAAFRWEVHTNVRSRERATQLAAALRRDGLPALATGNRLSVLAIEEEQAGELADRVRIEAGVPTGVSVRRVSRLRRWWLRQRWYGNYGLGAGEIFGAEPGSDGANGGIG